MADEELLPDTRRALRHRLASAQVEGRAPVIVAGVVRGGEQRWFDGVGDVGDDASGTAFRIGSITKTFTSALVLRLRDEGRLDLGDHIGRHVPEARPGDVTIAQLLAHSGGLVAGATRATRGATPCGRTSRACSTSRAACCRE
jgi:CubicO group peptidase (beta-lactamase class C family)